MADRGVDLGDRTPREVTPDELRGTDLVVTMGCSVDDVWPTSWEAADRPLQRTVPAYYRGLVVRYSTRAGASQPVIAETDDRGRLYLPKEIRERYGEKYHVVQHENRISLVPVADDPLAAVREAAGDLREASIEEIREDIEAEARAEAGETDTDR